MYGILIERGHVPGNLPPELQAAVGMLASHRFAGGVSNADGSIACSVAADRLDLVLVPCMALLATVGAPAQWVPHLGPEAQAELLRMGAAA